MCLSVPESKVSDLILPKGSFEKLILIECFPYFYIKNISEIQTSSDFSPLTVDFIMIFILQPPVSI